MAQWWRSHLQCRRCRRPGVQSLGQEDPLGREMATHSSILAGQSHGQRSLAEYSPWGHKDLDMTERVIYNLLDQNWVFEFPSGSGMGFGRWFMMNGCKTQGKRIRMWTKALALSMEGVFSGMPKNESYQGLSVGAGEVRWCWEQSSRTWKRGKEGCCRACPWPTRAKTHPRIITEHILFNLLFTSDWSSRT